MPNTSENAYALTVLCPIKNNAEDDTTPILYTRKVLQNNLAENPQDNDDEISPMALVPNTYLARFFILDHVPFQGYPNQSDNVKSSYLVFVADFHGELDPYLKGMFKAMKDVIPTIWKYCYGFDEVLHSKENDGGESAFVRFIKKCQVETTFYFNGSNTESLAEQLKSLYLKQELSKFVFDHQGVAADKLLSDFKTFIKDKKPGELSAPTWKAGSSKRELDAEPNHPPS